MVNPLIFDQDSLDQIIKEEINNYELQVDKLTSICNLFIEVTNVPVSVLLSLKKIVDDIKNNDIASAVNILEKTYVQVQSLGSALDKSIQILKQEI